MGVLRRILTALLVLACTSLVAAAPGKPGAQATEVRIADHRYLPETLTVARGATVRWVNQDDDPHTVTSDGDAFASPGMDQREGWSFTFATPGSYPYHCALHPSMTGTVVVK